MRNYISRRHFLKAAGVAGAAGLLAACGSSSTASSSASSDSAVSVAPAEEDVTLSLKLVGRRVPPCGLSGGYHCFYG